MTERSAIGNRTLPTEMTRNILRPPAHHENGFTLLELLVVLIIMVTVIAAFPLVLNRAFPARRVRLASEHLRNAVRRCEIRSIAFDRPLRLSIAQMTADFPNTTHLHARTLEGRPLHALFCYPDGSTTGGIFGISDGAARNVITVSEITGRITERRP